jgi:hypothetical protein
MEKERLWDPTKSLVIKASSVMAHVRQRVESEGKKQNKGKLDAPAWVQVWRMYIQEEEEVRGVLRKFTGTAVQKVEYKSGKDIDKVVHRIRGSLEGGKGGESKDNSA